MRHFEWRRITKLGEVHPRIFIIEVNELGGHLFWGVLEDAGDLYFSPKLITRDRNAYIEIREFLSLKDAKEAAEKKLFDEGVILDGDTLEDYT